ncbi:hypothetical protein LSTR_LSTR001480 [Laodelphax striatellus]|uniref:Gustatory receptor n=1 Tax=Laodelphax striatellus TaxID=195883 RepID=A0A482X9N7_LAOST|nr:hypothetical protein LSTR_LSTR001480 [Laodelphax striatellus]
MNQWLSFYTHTILGVVPYTYKGKQRSKAIENGSLSSYYFQSLLLSSSMCWLMYQSMVEIYYVYAHSYMNNQSSLRNMVFNLYMITHMIFMAVSSFGSFLRLKSSISLIDKIEELDHRLKHSFQYKSPTVTHVTVVIYVLSVAWYQLDCYIKRATVYWTHAGGAVAVSSLFLFHLNFTKLVSHVASLFSTLNEKIRRIDCMELAFDTSHVFTVQEFKGGSASEDEFSLLNLSKLHTELCDVIEHTSRIFSGQIFAAMLLFFVHMIVHPFIASIVIIKPSSIRWLTISYIANHFTFLFGDMISLIQLVEPCSKLTDQANETSTIVCELLNRRIPLGTRTQLERFERLLYHGSTELTVFGMFSMTRPVIMGAIGAVTTYLVILVQFLEPDKQKQNDNCKNLTAIMPHIIAPIEEIPHHQETSFKTDQKLNVVGKISLKLHKKIIIFFFSCFGVISYDEELIENHLHNLPYKFYCQCSLVVCSVLITAYGAKLYQSTGEIYTMEDNPSIVGIAVSYFRIISIISFLLTSSLKSLERWKGFVEVIEKIKQLNSRLDVKFVKLGQRGSIITIGIYATTNGIHKSFSMLKDHNEFFLIPIGNLMVFIMIMFELNLRKIVLHLCALFDAINISLEQFGNQHMNHYHNNLYLHRRGRQKQSLTITQLSDLHRELCGVVQDVSNTFGGQNISLMFFLVFYITFCPYKIFICFLKPTVGWEYIENIAILVCWWITYLAMLFVLIVPCSSATSKANKTASIVSNILTMKNMTTQNYSEVEKFSRQLLHHSTEFTVKDMFTLNLSLITTIAGAVTTYLVILIQFEDTFL